MKNFSFVLLGSFILAFAQGWSPLNSGTTQTLNSVYFVSSDTGWVVGDSGTILKTVDGGLNWKKQKSLFVTNKLRAVRFMNSNIGWAVGDGGTVLRTPDGGTTWYSQTLASGGFLYSVFFYASSGIGWAVGSTDDLSRLGYGTSVIYKSTDGGGNWTQQSGAGRGLRSVYFSDNNNGWAVGVTATPSVDGKEDPDRNRIILKTTNGGATWVAQDSGSGGLFSICGIGKQYLWTVGEGVNISIESGATWMPESYLSGGIVRLLRSVHFVNVDTGYAVGGGGYTQTGCPPLPTQDCQPPPSSSLIKTVDGGANWVLETTGTTNTLLSVQFPASDVGYTVGNGGTILKYGPPVDVYPGFHNSGSIWVNPNGGLEYNLAFPTEVRILSLDAQGRLLSNPLQFFQQPGEYFLPPVVNSSNLYFLDIHLGNFHQTLKLKR